MLNNMGCAEEIEAMLEIKVYEMGGEEEIFKVTDDELMTKKLIKFRLEGCGYTLTLLEFARRLGLYHVAEISEEGFEVYFQGSLRSDENFNGRDYWLSVSSKEELHLSRSLTSTIRKPILKFITKMAKRMNLLTDEVLDGLSTLVFYRALDATTLRELISYNGKLIAKDQAPGLVGTDVLSLEQHLSLLRQIFCVLRAQKSYANGKKCHFLVAEVTFLGYIVTGSGIKIDPAKVEAIISWPTPSTIHGIHIFQVECDASGVGIGGVLSQNQRPIAFFSEKLNDVRRKYSTYDKEFYAIVRSLDTWQHKLKSRHAKFECKFSKLDGYMFKGVRLCIPLCSLRKAIVLEGHAGGLAGHFGREDVSLDFVLGFPHTQQAKDFVLSSGGLYFIENVKLHGVPKTLTSDRDVKFVSHFWRTLWNHLLSKLQFSCSHHPQNDGHTEVVNQSLGNLLRSLIEDNAKQWDLILPLAEFAYNRSVNRTTCKSPFEVMYRRNPITPLNLVHVLEVRRFSEEWANGLTSLSRLKSYIDQFENRLFSIMNNTRNMQISVVSRRFGKLKPRGDGPFCVLKKINDNTYKIELPGHYNVSATFNVPDLSPYKGDSNDKPESESSLFQEGEDDPDAVNERVNMTNTLGAYFSATNFYGGMG
ncbi:RNA-directed DNA polymerase [Tanacetum coccineum]